MKSTLPFAFSIFVLSLTVAACNETTRDISFTRRDQSVVVPVLTNDRFKAADNPDVTTTSTPAHGGTVVNADNTVSYSPNAGFVGVDRFTYTVLTAQNKTFTENVVVTVRPPYNHHGCNFSPYIDGQDPRTGGTVTPEQLAARIEFIAPYCEWIRFFGLADDLLDGPRIAKDLGMKVAAGAWIDFLNEADDQEQVDRLISISPYADVLIVGNEVLLRRSSSVPMASQRLIGYINQVKSAVPAKPVTTAEEDQRLKQFPDIFEAVDVVYANIYPWWDGTPLEISMFQLYQNYLDVVAMAGGKEVVIAETGWKSAGTSNGNALPTVPNEVFYHTNLATFVRATGVKAFLFGAFDEPWKSAADASWGIWDTSLQMKSGMQDVFEGASTINNWGTEPIGGPGTPSIQFTHVPAYGQTVDEFLLGQVQHVAPNLNRIVVYINVPVSGSPRWWVKPYEQMPITNIAFDGTFATDIYGGPWGVDERATQVAAFVIPLSYAPPRLLGATSFPPDLLSNAVANLTVNR